MKKWILGSLIGVLAISLAGWLFWPVSPAFDAYQRMRLGMTRDEVDEVIGKPHGARVAALKLVGINPAGLTTCPDSSGRAVHETGFPVTSVVDSAALHDQSEILVGPAIRGWACQDQQLWVLFDGDGRVAGYSLLDSAVRRPSLFERLRAWIGL
jgi:hypothetical protein